MGWLAMLVVLVGCAQGPVTKPSSAKAAANPPAFAVPGESFEYRVHSVRYDGSIERERSFTAWVSDDPSRVPLRFELGSEFGVFVVELVAYQSPADRRP